MGFTTDFTARGASQCLSLHPTANFMHSAQCISGCFNIAMMSFSLDLLHYNPAITGG